MNFAHQLMPKNNEPEFLFMKRNNYFREKKYLFSRKEFDSNAFHTLKNDLILAVYRVYKRVLYLTVVFHMWYFILEHTART